MQLYRQVSAFILAGGASSRMGQPKGLLDFGGIPLIVHSAQLIGPLVAGVTVFGSPHRYAPLGLRAIEDDRIEARNPSHSDEIGDGPLAGIAAPLSATHSPWNLILACDLPYLSAEWIDWLLARALRSDGLALIPRSERGIEPLAGVYRRQCGAPIKAALTRGMRKVTETIQELPVDIVDRREWSHVDPKGLVLRNMNTPADYENALKWRALESPSAPE